MNLDFSPAEESFREEVRAFLRDHLPERLSAAVRAGQRVAKTDFEEWHAILNARGWLAAGWPVEWGGTGWTVAQRHIFEVEAACAYAPHIQPFGVSMFGPVVIRYGTDAHKRRWLPRILDGSDWWCQGYSEPGAGSDLAAIKTSAVRDGDHYVVNGQKIWTSYAQYANMIFCLVRTDPDARKQEGISFLAIDMTTPGVELRPIKLMDGDHEVNEIFFTDVRVPCANLIGEENSGWTYAKYLLTHERTGAAFIGESLAEFANLRRIVAKESRHGRPLSEDPGFAMRLARLEIDIENMRTTNLRFLSAAAGGAAPMAESAMLKIRGSAIRQKIRSLARRAAGPYAMPYVTAALDHGYDGEPVGPDYAASLATSYFNGRKFSIYAGSNEVQREIIAKLKLEL